MYIHMNIYNKVHIQIHIYDFEYIYKNMLIRFAIYVQKNSNMYTNILAFETHYS